MDSGAWWATGYRVAKSWTRLSDETTNLTTLCKYYLLLSKIFQHTVNGEANKEAVM